MNHGNSELKKAPLSCRNLKKMKELLQPFMKMLTAIIGLLLSVSLLLIIVLAILVEFKPRNINPITGGKENAEKFLSKEPSYNVLKSNDIWVAPEWSTVDAEPNAAEIRYGRELIVNTAEYLGPRGKIKKISNGMNCQNCHLQAGTAPFGNNYSAVASTYPKTRARSGHLEDIPKRINDCFERSLNGLPLPLESKEMKSIVAYMEWLGKDVAKGESPKGAGIYDLPFLDRAADPVRGKTIYERQCQNCHMENGGGIVRPDDGGFVYPPLWGKDSYNQGAGLFRLSRFAGFVKANMPLGASYDRPVLTDEQAWDVAAYINSLDRPLKNLNADWPDISQKPVDHPFGPYSDSFPEEQHKFGPYKPIAAARQIK
jgi:thiosulfate dehydrogenase